MPEGRGQCASRELLTAARLPLALAILLPVVLDRNSSFESYTSFGIAPWNPGTGLSFVLILVFGRQLIPLRFVALLLADVINRQVVLP